MPTPLTKAYDQLRRLGVPTPEQQMAAKDEELRRAFATRVEGHPVNLLEALKQVPGRSAQSWGESFAARGRELQEILGQDVAQPGEGMVSIPEALRRRGTGPGVGVAAALMGPAGLPYLASPSQQQEVNIGQQFMPGVAALEMTPEATFRLLEGTIAKKSAKIAQGYAQHLAGGAEELATKLQEEAMLDLAERINEATKKGRVSPAGHALLDFTDEAELFEEGIYPRWKKNISKLAGEERKFVQAGEGAEGLGEEVGGALDEAIERVGGGENIGLTMKEVGEAATPEGMFARLAQRGGAEAPGLPPIKGKTARAVAMKVVRGESPTRALIEGAKKGTYYVTLEGKTVPTGNLVRQGRAEGLRSPLKVSLPEQLPVESLRPNVLLKKLKISEDAILDAVDEVVGAAPARAGLPRLARFAKIYLTEGGSPQELFRKSVGRSGRAVTQQEINYFKSRLNTISDRVLERFGGKLGIEEVNKLLKSLE